MLTLPYHDVLFIYYFVITAWHRLLNFHFRIDFQAIISRATDRRFIFGGLRLHLPMLSFCDMSCFIRDYFCQRIAESIDAFSRARCTWFWRLLALSACRRHGISVCALEHRHRFHSVRITIAGRPTMRFYGRCSAIDRWASRFVTLAHVLDYARLRARGIGFGDMPRWFHRVDDAAFALLIYLPIICRKEIDTYTSRGQIHFAFFDLLHVATDWFLSVSRCFFVHWFIDALAKSADILDALISPRFILRRWYIFAWLIWLFISASSLARYGLL